MNEEYNLFETQFPQLYIGEKNVKYQFQKIVIKIQSNTVWLC